MHFFGRSSARRGASGWTADRRGEVDHYWHPPWWDPELHSRRAQRRSAVLFRLLAPVVISLFVQMPAVLFSWSGKFSTHVVPWDTVSGAILSIGVAAAGPLALLAARRFPGPVVAFVAIAASADLLLASGDDGPPYIAFAFAIGSAIIRGARIWAWATIAVSWLGTLIISATLGIAWQPWRIVGITFGILLLVALAEAIRANRQRVLVAAQQLRDRRQTELQAERVRIARELHDVLAHSLSQINVQAGVGLHLIDKQPEQAREALASIKEASKSALDEVRSVLGILRAEDGADPSAPLVPEPDLGRLDALVNSMNTSACAVTLDNALTPDLRVPKPVQLAIYRIVQESLTNVARHAEASRATVRLAVENGNYVVRVSDNGTKTNTPRANAGRSGSRGSNAAPAGGRGLLGMRERAELLGGSLDAGPSDEGFAVHATIPIEERQ